ncbi:hypothetical protein E0J20_09135 [Rhizobium leguminosarum bv. viciae]|nr:hypothetical protein E0J20_09135 [Rhizobium leguminosarum bv. viciae]
MTPSSCLVLIGGGFVIFGFVFPGADVLGMTLMGLAFVIMLIQNLRFRSIGPVGLVVITVVIAAFLGPVFFTLTGKPDADELAINEKVFANVCPVWVAQNLFGRYVTYRDRAWCSAYEDRLSPMIAAPAKIDGEATGSITSTTNALWK